MIQNNIRRVKKWYIYHILDPIGHKIFQNKAEEIDTVVVLVGPYRNLTTLIASAMALHPNCRVLNHAGSRILGKEKIDFLKENSARTFQNFKRFALYASLGGAKGNFGGSIFHSHAFDNPMIKQKAANQKLLKEGTIKSLLWKESLLVTNYLRDKNISTDSLIRKIPSIKFLMPIRNPLACAKSNWDKGKYEEYYKNCNTYEDVLKSIVQDYRWYLNQKRLNPDHFLHFYEDSINEETLRKICDFIHIQYYEDWGVFILENMMPSKSYQFDQTKKNALMRILESNLKDYPDFKNRIIEIAEIK
mgnify:CR=1 FL=1